MSSARHELDIAPDDVWRALAEIPDPEIPVISVVDLGVVKDVRIDDSTVHVEFTPTFMGCPALETMRTQIEEAIRGLGPSKALWLDRASYWRRLGEPERAAEAQGRADRIEAATARDHYLLAISYARNFYDSDQRPLREILARYERPMLVLHGKRDALVPVEAAVEHARIVPQAQLVAAVVGSLERLDVRDRDEQASMNPHEVARELLFELTQRLLDELLAATVPNRHVFLIGAEETNVLDRNQLELVAHAYRDVLPSRELGFGKGELVELR